MGNKIARTTQASASEYYLHDLPSSYNLVLIELLGRGRFFKSILCKHDEGLVLVKVYFKRGDPLDLKEYERKLREIREIFRNVQHSHLWPFQFWLETDKAAYLLRQHFISNLHDRLSTRPFLSLIEKKWLAFQLLCAVKQSHENGVCHGDIKCENVLVTSWNWLYLTDFASFKPTYIPDDDPSDFSFFFDTGGRRRCYLAPERFYEHGGEAQIPLDSPLKPSMDIFSLGCAIAELFLEGQSLFELSQLLAYRRGQYDPRQCLEKIPDIGIQRMILHMIQLDPESRLSCESYLQEYGSIVFPCYFSPFLHKFFSCMTPLDSDTRVAVIQGAFQEIIKQLASTNSSMEITSKKNLVLNVGKDEPSNSIENVSQRNSSPTGDVSKTEVKKDLGTTHIEFVGEISHLLKEVEKQSNLAQGNSQASGKVSNDAQKDFMLPSNFGSCLDRASNMQLNLPRSCNKRDHFLKGIRKQDLSSIVDGCNNQPDALLMSFFPDKHCTVQSEGMVLIASLICSCIRSVRQPQLRRAAVLLLMSSSLYIDDEERLQHVIPYVIVMLSDTAAIVRCAALETLCNILPLVQDFPPSDAKIFPEYILPMLSMLPDDPEESVRICYARNIFKIALTAYRFLVSSEKSSEFSTLSRPPLPSKPPVASADMPGKRPSGNFESELTQLRRSISEVVHELVMGPKQTANIRRALLQDVGHLCYFFGQRQSNDVLLPILPAFLNDRDELLRADFYGKIIYVCLFIGQRSVEEYLLPYIDQALNDDNEDVVVNALECLTVLCKSGNLRKRILLDMVEKSFSLLCYPMLCVRRECVRFIAATAENLGPVDSYVYLSPVLRPFLYREPTSLCSEAALLSSLKPPVSKLVYYKVLEQARSSEMLERQRKIWYNSSAFSNQEEDVENVKNMEGNSNLKINSNKLQGMKHTSTAMRNLTIADAVEAKPVGLEGTLSNISATVDGKERLPSSNKLQFSGFVSPHVSDGANLLSDGPSEGIPLYSFSMNRYARQVSQWDTPIRSLSTPWVGNISKSFVLSSSEPPKLVSGSIYTINNSSKKKPLSLQDEDTSVNDQSSYTTGKFHDVSASDTLKGSSSIAGEDASQQHDGAGPSSLAMVSSLPDAGWRPRGALVAHLQEHQSAVNDIAVSYDHSFFVSASDDSTVKIWDTRKLEKDISFRSRLTYPLDGSRALCTTMLHGNAEVLVGASDGMIHLFSVDYISRGQGNVVERYSGFGEIKKKQINEGAILSILDCSAGDGSVSPSVLFSTQSCGVHLWDTRTDTSGWKFKAAPDNGYISSLVMGLCGNWFVSGTSRGVLTLWDMRFLLPVYSWKYSSVCPVEKMCLYIPPPKSTLSATGRPLIYVAAGCNELSLWNAEIGSCHQIFRVVGCEGDAEITSRIPWALSSSSNKLGSKQLNKRNPKTSYRDDELDEPPPRLPGIRALLPLPGGDLLTGGTDLRIRYLDHSSPGRSFFVCGPSMKGVGPEDLYETRSVLGVQVVQEVNKRPQTTNWTQKALLAVAATDSAGCHHDSILSLASVKLNQRLLISSSRDGAIKVWK